MAGITIEQMGPGRAKFRPSLTSPGFPTLTSRRVWDHQNARVLRAAAAVASDGPDSRWIESLADDLHPSWEPVPRSHQAYQLPNSHVPATMASNRRRTVAADEFGAHGWELVEALEEPPHFFTIVPTYGTVDEPAAVNPKAFKQRIRNDLNSRGALGSDGILIAVIEAEYQMRTGLWRFHAHGVASEEKLGAVRRLRELPAYRTIRKRPGEAKSEVAYRVKVASQPLFDLPKPLTYCIKTWNARWTDEHGNRGRRRRLPREVIPTALLWQDHWSLAEITLLMGMRPGRDGFVVLNSTRIKDK